MLDPVGKGLCFKFLLCNLQHLAQHETHKVLVLFLCLRWLGHGNLLLTMILAHLFANKFILQSQLSNLVRSRVSKAMCEWTHLTPASQSVSFIIAFSHYQSLKKQGVFLFSCYLRIYDDHFDPYHCRPSPKAHTHVSHKAKEKEEVAELSHNL